MDFDNNRGLLTSAKSYNQGVSQLWKINCISWRGSMENRQEVVVTDIRMSFTSMVMFMIKWVIASIPAFIILSIMFSVIMALFGGFMGGMMHR